MKKLSKLKLKDDGLMTDSEMKMVIGGSEYGGEIACADRTTCSGSCGPEGKRGTCKTTPISMTCDCWT